MRDDDFEPCALKDRFEAVQRSVELDCADCCDCLPRLEIAFEGRDEDGNELPRDLCAGPARPRSSSPSHDRGHEPRQRGSGPSLLSSESQREAWDGITASPPAIPKDYISDGGSSYGSSFPSTMPTPLRNFLEMFPDTQTQDHVELESSHLQDEDTYDL